MPKKQKSSLSKLTGKVQAFNISPKGQIEGILVETKGGRAQINFPKHLVEALTAAMHLGSAITVSVKREADEGEHPVYTAHDDDAEATGFVVALNYALHGEVNGYHLTDGTFAHVKPEGAKKYKLSVGDRVRAIGVRRTGSRTSVLEVRTLERLGVPEAR